MDQRVDDVKTMIDSLSKAKIKMDDHWVGEPSQRFLPKFVVNLTSNKIQAVRDSECILDVPLNGDNREIMICDMTSATM